jgi:branched-chain amino acid transport system permease protein
MVMYAPGGIASLIMMNMRAATFGKLKRLWVHYVPLVLVGLVALAGAAAMIEMVYQLQLNEALGPQMLFLGLTLDANGAGTWVAAVAVFALGVALFEWRRRGLQREWSRIQEEIATEIQHREGVA